jgi:hypothetical protein
MIFFGDCYAMTGMNFGAVAPIEGILTVIEEVEATANDATK